LWNGKNPSPDCSICLSSFLDFGICGGSAANPKIRNSSAESRKSSENNPFNDEEKAEISNYG
jgi:hypothetical protein